MKLLKSLVLVLSLSFMNTTTALAWGWYDYSAENDGYSAYSNYGWDTCSGGCNNQYNGSDFYYNQSTDTAVAINYVDGVDVGSRIYGGGIGGVSWDRCFDAGGIEVTCP
ncbi:MAG: hypothetical protein K2X47_12515 [Bdellovibrionales bacterium]|nr:hypothetical protein [Bdellovibrionales bacterium]